MTELPSIESGAQLNEFRQQPERWTPVIVSLARSNGLPTVDFQNLGGDSSLVIAIGKHYVVKLTPPVFARQIQAEEHALKYIGKGLPLRTPQLCATGNLDSWRYVVQSRIPGQQLGESWPTVSQSARRSILQEIGLFFAALHRLAAPQAGVLADSWDEFLSMQTQLCAARQASWGVPEEIVSGISECLANSGVSTNSCISLLHADLGGGNVLLESVEDGRYVAGIIDFGDARIGDPLYDLITPALLIAEGNHELFSALLDGYGIVGSARDERLQTRLTAYAVLHPFNDLTRYLRWAEPTPTSLEEFGKRMFPL